MIRDTLSIAEYNGPLRYLEVPMLGHRLQRSNCVKVEQSIRGRLEGWQARALFMMDRDTLVRSILSSIFVSILLNTVLPKILVGKLEQYFQKFIWGLSPGDGGVHLIAWDAVCQSLMDGDLEIQSLIARREALIARHAAHFLLDLGYWWSRIMSVRYRS